MDKKILVIMGEYPPRKSPTAISMSAFVKKLQEKYSVTCLVKQQSRGEKGYDANGVRVYTVCSSVFDLLCNTGIVQKNRCLKMIVELCKRLKLRVAQLITIPIYPNQAPMFQKRMCKKAYSICKKEGIDAIVSVCFPPETVRAGNYVKERLNDIKFLPCLIDALSCGAPAKYLPKQYAKYRKFQAQLSQIMCADSIIVMQASKNYYQQVAPQLQERMHFLNPPFLVQPSKKTTKDIPQGILEADKINILFTGYLGLPDRDPTYIIRLLSELGRQDICLVFIGGGNADAIIEAEKINFCGSLKKLGFMQHDELKQVMAHADIFLNLGVSNSNAISGKIFEYMAFGKPILSTYFDSKDATLPYLEQYSSSCCINQMEMTKEQALDKIRLFLQRQETAISFEQIQKKFYTSTPEAFIEVVDSVLEEKK